MFPLVSWKGGREGGREVGEDAVFLGPFIVEPVRVGYDFSEGVALEPEGGREGGRGDE